MKHAVIQPANRALFQRTPRPSRHRHRLPATGAAQLPHSAAATRFAAACAAIGGVTMLHDLMPDVVTVSFGARTDSILARLHALGWTFVGAGDWQGERVLGVSFSGDRRSKGHADALADAMTRIVGKLEIAETRIW